MRGQMPRQNANRPEARAVPQNGADAVSAENANKAEAIMFDLIHGNLTRQFKALELLSALLTEEFEMLRERDTDAVTNLEFSIHELLRQVAVERAELKSTMQGTRVLEYAGMLPDEEGASVRRLLHVIDALEQTCSRQASQNAEFSLMLMDQSQSLLVFLHDQIAPRTAQVYGSGGRLRADRPSAALISGRL